MEDVTEYKQSQSFTISQTGFQLDVRLIPVAFSRNCCKALESPAPPQHPRSRQKRITMNHHDVPCKNPHVLLHNIPHTLPDNIYLSLLHPTYSHRLCSILQNSAHVCLILSDRSCYDPLKDPQNVQHVATSQARLDGRSLVIQCHTYRIQDQKDPKKCLNIIALSYAHSFSYVRTCADICDHCCPQRKQKSKCLSFKRDRGNWFLRFSVDFQQPFAELHG